MAASIFLQEFGVNEFAARLPSVIAGAVAVLLTYDLGRRMFSPVTGLLAGLIAVSTVQVSVLAHAATPDSLLLACLMLTFWLFWIGAENGSRHWTWAIGLGAGLAVLAKGPVGLVMPAAIIGFISSPAGKGADCWIPAYCSALAVVIAIAGPWYALVGAETRGRFLRTFWQTENVGRFLAPMEGHSGSIVYYPLTLIVGLAPWSIVIFPVLFDALRSVSVSPSPGFAEEGPGGRGLLQSCPRPRPLFRKAGRAENCLAGMTWMRFTSC